MTFVPGASVSKRRKIVADGIFHVELNEFFQRELAQEGYSSVEVHVTPTIESAGYRHRHETGTFAPCLYAIEEIGLTYTERMTEIQAQSNPSTNPL